MGIDKLTNKESEELTDLAQKVDKILKEQLKKYKIEFNIAEARVYNVKNVGVQGDQRTYSHPAEITLYQNENFVWDPKFLAELSTRITNEIEGNKINRVVYVIGIKNN